MGLPWRRSVEIHPHGAAITPANKFREANPVAGNARLGLGEDENGLQETPAGR